MCQVPDGRPLYTEVRDLPVVRANAQRHAAVVKTVRRELTRRLTSLLEKQLLLAVEYRAQYEALARHAAGQWLICFFFLLCACRCM